MKCSCKNCQWEGSHDLGGGIYFCSKHLERWNAIREAEKPFEWLKFLISHGERLFPQELDSSYVNSNTMRKPRIVCLCGSTRFYKEFVEANFEETMAGRIVLSVGFYPHAAKEVHGQEIGISPDQKVMLDELHLRKIDLAHEILVLNVGCHIGESTSREIEYARKQGKPIRYLDKRIPIQYPDGQED